LGEAARVLGVSADTLRRWERAGKLRTERDEANRRRVPAEEIDRLVGRPARHEAGDSLSARNRLAVDVLSVTAVGNRVRVGLATPQPLAAEVTGAAAHELELRAGARVEATFKATATRLVTV